jgi:hypothetical protein
LHLLLLISIAGNLLLVILNWKVRQGRSDRIFLSALFLFSFVFWFLNAPDYRFIYGFLFPSAAFPVALLLARLSSHPHPAAARLVDKALWVSSLSAVALIFSAVIVFSQWYQNPWLRSDPYPPPVVHLEQVAGLPVYVPDTGDQCWDAPLPCTPFPGVGFRMRGPTLQHGFTMIPEDTAARPMNNLFLSVNILRLPPLAPCFRVILFPACALLHAHCFSAGDSRLRPV